jgi:hypothetical protein
MESAGGIRSGNPEGTTDGGKRKNGVKQSRGDDKFVTPMYLSKIKEGWSECHPLE